MTILPVEYRSWAADSGVDDGRAVTPVRRAAARAPHHDEAGLRITNPPDGATYWIDPTLRREFQALTFKAVSSSGGRVEWLVDGTPVGSAESNGSVVWPLTPGTHRITARDEHGGVVETMIRVR